ncbi:MAG TPA: DUF4097 family beta strand repeat-containing protein [Terriglobales bacterium]|jgi:DUF4097 and DUF4098 domain-containing protein YvlB
MKLRRSFSVISALLFAIPLLAADHPDRLTAEFHQTYPLSAGGRVELSNINGAVHITGWDRSEVKVDAVKSAYSQERLDEAKIKVDASGNRVSIRTEYPERDHDWRRGSYDNPASVEYTISVPRGVRLDKIELINGNLDIQDVNAEVSASCINGRLQAHGLSGRLDLSTINGSLEAGLDRIGESSVDLSSVNGSVSVTLPSDAQADVEASTVHGGIDNDFGLKADRHHWVGSDLRAQLGKGGTHIKLSNVNGGIEIHHANDGRTVSPAKVVGSSDDDDDEI